MKLVIKDQEGNEVGFDRISLIPGGIEIILDAERIRVPGSDTAVPIVEPVPSNVVPDAFKAEIPELPQVADRASKEKSIFSEGTGGNPPPPPAQVSDVELDNDGCPWDARIHSSSKKQTAKKIWAKRKNLAEGLYDQIKAELLSGTAQPESQTISTDRPTPKTPPVPPVAAGKQTTPPVPPVPGNVESAASNVPTPPAGEGAVPPPPPPVPDNNVIGDSNDSQLDSIMSEWGAAGN